MGKVITVVVSLLLLGGVVFYYQRGRTEENPRALIQREVANARAQQSMSAEEAALLQVQLALVDFTARNGMAPNSLSELVPTYFDVLPKAGDGKPFPYKKVGSTFALGDQTEEGRTGRAEGEAAVGGKGSEIARGAAPGEAVETADFVNPNTMAPETFVYDPSGKRDPFQPFDLSDKRVEGASPLTSYALDQLRVSAILSSPGAGQGSAVVEDATGKGYTVKVGTRVGNGGGTIVAIEPDKIKVLESRVDFTGQENQNLVEMKLEQKSGDRKDPKKRPEKKKK